MIIEPLWLLVTTGASLGAILASFFTVVGERSIRDESLEGRSHCRCGRQLLWRENIPIVGWLATGGVARCCRRTIPTRYVAGEALSATAVGAATYLFAVPGMLSTLAVTQIVVWAAARNGERNHRATS